MTTVASFRIEELLKPDMPERFFEVIEGVLIMMSPAGWKHNIIARRFFFLFHRFCKTHPGLAYGGDPDAFVLKRDPDNLLCPDAALFKLRPRSDDDPWMEFPPEIAVEILSPSNKHGDMARKRRLYFEGGTEQVWIADPARETIEFHFREGRRVTAGNGETVHGEGIAEGLKIELKKIFAAGAF